MELVNTFVVPRPIDLTWAVLTDVERIAPCMPGAQLREVDGDTYHGSVKVKVGPIVAQFNGQARFTELDVAAHRAVLTARGKETGGRSLASALVTAQLTDEGDVTRIDVTTDLTLSGRLAQFGRGAFAEISTKLINQFADQLERTVLADEPVPTPEPEPVNLLGSAGWPIAKRVLPVLLGLAVVVAVLVVALT